MKYCSRYIMNRVVIRVVLGVLLISSFFLFHEIFSFMRESQSVDFYGKKLKDLSLEIEREKLINGSYPEKINHLTEGGVLMENIIYLKINDDYLLLASPGRSIFLVASPGYVVYSGSSDSQKFNEKISLIQSKIEEMSLGR